MHCHDIVDQIIAQSGRTALTPEIESHLAGCQTCSEVYFEQQALWRHMDAWEVPEVSAGFDRRLFARIGQRAAQPWAVLDWFMRLLHPIQPGFAMALACMLIVAGVVVRQGRYNPAPAGPTAVVQTVDDPQQIQVALDDIQMLSDFEILPVAQEEKGKS